MATRKYRRLEDWKSELIGKTFDFLFVKDVIQCVNKDGKKRYVALCECKCGNICNIDVYGLSSGHNKSCGCYETSLENSERHKEINRNNKQLRSESRKQWCANNPDKVKDIGNKVSKWARENPDKVAERAEKQSQWCKDNPDKVKERSEKYIEWCENNKDKVADMIAKQQQWRNDIEKVRAANEKRLLTFANNPDILINAGKKISEWRNNNKDIVIDSIKAANKANKDAATVRRCKLDFSDIIDSVHPDYVENLLHGNIKGHDCILIKCPQCGEYAGHKLSNVFVLSKQQVRYNSTVLCSKCHRNIAKSKYEQEIANYISTFYVGKCIRNARSILNGKELDLYYPEKKIAIEFNGDYWHSSKIKSSDYHYNKFIECKERNVTLVSIFEYYWLTRGDEIKEYLIDLFGGRNNKISFNKNGYINNNYPPPIQFDSCGEPLSEFYMVNKYKVFTCGYTKYER